jgi:hypothetical protein
LNATAEQQYLVDKILLQDQGITYGLFQAEEADAGAAEETKDEEVEEGEPGEDGEPVPRPKKPKPEKLPKHVLVPEVVEEPKMHYYSVPKLGSYLAIKLEYESCISEEAFDAAVVNLQEVEAKKAAQHAEKTEFEDL